MCVVALFAVPKAHASTADFCGTSSSPRGYPYGDRCAAGYHGAVGFTRFSVASGEGSNFMCALVKENADGGGGNRAAPACAYSTVQESDCTTAYNPCSGYATNTNAWTSIVGFAGWGYFEYSF
jgi:hypothetical protein